MSHEPGDDQEFEHITTDAAVETYKESSPIFSAILKEMRTLSAKKPEATMSTSKVKLVNQVLNDLLVILKDEPAGKYLRALDEDMLPQVSDAVLAMVQFETALKSFQSRYLQRVSDRHYWITTELLETWRSDAKDDGDSDPADDDDDDEVGHA